MIEDGDQMSLIEREMRLTLDNLDHLLGVDPQMFVDHMRVRWSHMVEVLTGDERNAFQLFRRTATVAQATHAAAQKANAELRSALETLGRVVAPKQTE